ncbi:hypothetical protein AMTRI_Chr04g253640 [Amborella trichopoda]
MFNNRRHRYIYQRVMEGPFAATWSACSCAHVLLDLPRFSFETERIKQALAIAFYKATFSRSLDILSKPGALWKPLFLFITSCIYFALII